MVFPFSPKPPPFTATTLIARIRTAFREFPDERRGGNRQRYTVDDAALSAFSVFFTQSPSFLDYQRRMQRRLGRNNAQSLFGVHQIPSDNQIRNLLDPVPPETLFPVVAEISEGLYHGGYLNRSGRSSIPCSWPSMAPSISRRRSWGVTAAISGPSATAPPSITLSS